MSDEQRPLLGVNSNDSERGIGDAPNSHSMRNNPWEFPGWGSRASISIVDGNIQSMSDVLTYSSINGSGTIGDASQVLEFKEEDVTLLGKKDQSLDLRATSQDEPVQSVDGSEHAKINQFLATAICGNDITSSIFYTSAICARDAGIWTPVSLLLVCLVLYLFRKVYGEVGSALPLNGGAYNVLLNTTSKTIASLAACLTLISYVATAVVSATSATQYLAGPGLWEWLAPHIYYSPIALLGFFAALNMVGIGESAIVALIIFVVHMITLLILVFASAGMLIYRNDWSIFMANWNAPSAHSVPYAIYFGFGAAMLGISGFETSSNFIEQQQPGVFPKTLRNMWATVTFFNPIIGALAVCTLSLTDIVNNDSGVLAAMAEAAVGKWLAVLVGADAFLVLSGSIITSYVGVIGLARRMSLDRCLPQFLLQVLPMRRTNHWIILGFFAICSSLYLLVQGNTETLAGVYTIAFLGVMCLFSIGNMLLKYKRSSLPREIRSSWLGVVISFSAVFAGLIATIIDNPQYLQYFAVYFVATAFLILVTLVRSRLLKILLFFTQIILRKFRRSRERVAQHISKAIQDINSQAIVFLASKDDPAYLNKAILYVRDNEQTNWIKIVHIYEDASLIPPNLQRNIEFLDHCYPKIRLDLITVHGTFSPATVDRLANVLNTPKNFMFIACPKDHLPHTIGDFGGVRMITHY
eukprot:TRINITY_DN2335_c0_g1_i1.p1 TRINITY_DN2335_c0_g1~~TRINITY_DN2335_c0_g1_i1.p1  ORF type:complete len:712 (-),score=178.00 TRINITY_DN2335_c0_g1_i1:162-2249(-)